MPAMAPRSPDGRSRSSKSSRRRATTISCPACQHGYDAEERRPLILPCSHSFCQVCVFASEDEDQKKCFKCGEDWSKYPADKLLTCYQLMPAQDDEGDGAEYYDAEEEEEKEKVQNENGVTEEVDICKEHGAEFTFWCDDCEVCACSKCLFLYHKSCDWTLVEERTSTLKEECNNARFYYAEQVQGIQDIRYRSSNTKLVSVTKAISLLQELKDDFEMYHARLDSLHMCGMMCLAQLEECERDADNPSSNKLKLLRGKVEIDSQLRGYLTLPAEPDSPIMKMIEEFEKMAQGNAKRQKTEFPKTLEGFGYHFQDGRLRSIETGKVFKFDVREDDQSYNQKHYEALGEVITEAVYDLLEKDCGLVRLPVPAATSPEGDEARNGGCGFVFASHDFMSAEKLMVLIHGSGVVRAGQWARRLIINHCLDSGTQIPFICRAHAEGYAVLVMNTNQACAPDAEGKLRQVKGSSSPTKHAEHVWRHYVQPSQARHVAIVAHSYGGVVTTDLFDRFKKEDFIEKVFAVAMTDSVHSLSYDRDSSELIKISRNWVTSDDPLDTDVSRRRGRDIPCVSAGCSSHEMTSWSSINSIFKFFGDRFDAVTGRRTAEMPPLEDEVVACAAAGEGKDGTPSVGAASLTDRSLSLPKSGRIPASTWDTLQFDSEEGEKTMARGLSVPQASSNSNVDVQYFVDAPSSSTTTAVKNKYDVRYFSNLGKNGPNDTGEEVKAPSNERSKNLETGSQVRSGTYAEAAKKMAAIERPESEEEWERLEHSELLLSNTGQSNAL